MATEKKTINRNKSKDIFNKILLDGVRAGHMPARTQESRDWFRNAAKQYDRRLDEKAIMRAADSGRLKSENVVGSMYMFFYDPKHKETLPYYDRFPLIFPFKKVDKGFLGINLHYLPLKLRADLMDNLYKLSSDDRYDEKTKLNITYEMLKSVAQNRYFAPCIKHYLNEHVRSEFKYIYPSEWDIALWLPTEKFVKKSKTQVWADTKQKLGIKKTRKRK